VRGWPLPAPVPLERHARSAAPTRSRASTRREPNPRAWSSWRTARPRAGAGHGRGWVSPEGNLHASPPAATWMRARRRGQPSPSSPRSASSRRSTLSWATPPARREVAERRAPRRAQARRHPAGGRGRRPRRLRLARRRPRPEPRLAPGPGETPYAAASLAPRLGVDLAPEAFLDRWLPALDARLDAWRAGGFAALRPAWLARAAGVGREVSLRLGEGAVARGRFADLGEDGTLVLETAPAAWCHTARRTVFRLTRRWRRRGREPK
jgi:hypothetical protein